jgi:hypothetical protein
MPPDAPVMRMTCGVERDIVCREREMERRR